MAGNFDDHATDSDAGQARKGVARARIALSALPNEVICCILEQTSHHTLVKLSTICRALNALVKPYLFDGLVLVKYSLFDLFRLYDDLFQESPIGKHGTLHNMHLKRLVYWLYEGEAEKREFAQKLDVLAKIINGLRSIKWLSLGISFHDRGGDMSLHPKLSCALMRILDCCRLKVQRHQLWLGPNTGTLSLEIAKAATASKVSEAIDAYSPHTLVSLGMKELHMTTLPSNLRERLNAGDVKVLGLEGGSDFWTAPDVSPKLRAFEFSWSDSDSPDSAGFASALGIIKSSSGSLQKLFLCNRYGVDPGPLPETLFPQDLIHLQYLDIFDTGNHGNSIFASILAYTKLENLETLRLVLKDIINLDYDVNKIMDKLPSIKSIELCEERTGWLRRPPDWPHKPCTSRSMYKVLESRCLERKILLRSTYDWPRCDSTDDFKRAWARVALLSKTLWRLDIDIKANTEAGEDVQSLPVLYLPCVQAIDLHISTAYADLCSHQDSGHASRWASHLYHLLERLQAPLNLLLRVGCHLNDKSTNATVQALTEAVNMNLFPNLNEIYGSISVKVDSRSSPETVMQTVAQLKETCRSATIHCDALESKVYIQEP